MEHLFAPWRFAYVTHTDAEAGCIFCAAADGHDPSLTVAGGERTFALLNRYPYTSGHTMVAPREHVGDLTQLDDATLAEMMRLAQRVMQALQRLYAPHGFNLGFNLGEAAGAGIADHLHLHVVPRWRGDTSFITVNANVRVLPEDLAETRAKLRQALEAAGA
ncbi:MAG: HIT family protein [Thermoanaerobaculales bacterium]